MELSELIKSTAVKAVGNSIQGYGVIWGDLNRKDITSEYFDKTTKGLTDVFEMVGCLPWLLEHGQDQYTKGVPIALIDEIGQDDVGLWYKSKIREHKLYKKFVAPLIEEGILYSSSGAFPMTKSVTPQGHVKSWTMAEISGTVKPVDHHQLSYGQISEVKSLLTLDFKSYQDAIKSFVDMSQLSEEQAEEEAFQADIEQRWKLIRLKQRQLDLSYNLLQSQRIKLNIEQLAHNL